jgi:hypothetical protein
MIWLVIILVAFAILCHNSNKFYQRDATYFNKAQTESLRILGLHQNTYNRLLQKLVVAGTDQERQQIFDELESRKQIILGLKKRLKIND